MTDPFDWDSFPNVKLTLWVARPFDTRDTAEAFLGILDHHGYRPDRIDVGEESNRYVPLQKHLDEYFRLWGEVHPEAVSKHVMLRRTAWPRGVTTVHINATGRLPFDLVGANLEVEAFRDPPHQEGFLALARDLYDLLQPTYGMLEFSETRHRRTGVIDLDRGLPGIFWGNFLGAEYTAMFGWAKLEALARELPVTAERLPDDGAFILLGGRVLDSGTEEMVALAEAVERFLGEEYFSKSRPSWPPKPLPFSMADALAGKVPPELLREHLLPQRPRQGKVPEFRYRDLRRKRQEEWERSGGRMVEEIVEDLGLELKGPGGVLMVDAETGKAVDLPEEFFEGDEEGGEEKEGE